MSLEWRGAAVAPDDEMPSPGAWEPVSVPGRPEQFAGAGAVAYETTFSDPRDESDAHALLVLNGTYAHTRVWCNGDLLANHDAYFEPLRVRLPEREEYRVVVECRAPEGRFGGLHATDQLPPERCVPGIWWDATLETRPDPCVSELSVRPQVSDEGVIDATVEVSATVLTAEPLDDRMTLSLRPEGNVRSGGMMDRARVSTDEETATVTYTMDVRDPSLWWPHDRGEQSRYVLRAKLGDDEHSVMTGLRTVSYDDGLRINGENVPVRGVTLLDPTAEDVARAVDANANLVRVRAQGTPPEVARACDDHGVLLWQDLPLSGPGSFDSERGADLATRLDGVYAQYPSFAAVGVHDEPVSSYADGLGSGVLDRLRFRWRAWRVGYDSADDESVASAVDSVPTFPVVGPPGIDPDAATLYPGWKYGNTADLSWLCSQFGVGDVVAGFGAGALGTPDPGDSPGFDSACHDRHVDGGLDKSQAYQTGVVREVAEMLRRRNASIVVVDSLRDVGGAGTGLLAADGTEKTAFSVLADSYEPTQVVLSEPTPGEQDIVVLHDRPEKAELTVEWDRNGDREQAEHTVGPFARVTVDTLTLSAGDDVTLAATDGQTVVKNEYRISE
ncbi:hydrolase [Haloarcula sp. CBA1130]|uniref:hydrolase n=1 Tax=unclassified Haloarcula TaxID=2624677 RepID=UPI0012480672|nr:MULTISPECIES: hydrolase [unclassified Haloarcula]KAA9396848.1 hydrolase [Haloarcula sp. CBA1129]KAA9401808.1 hydrolase [Haloarcula sp. CBA1130]